MPSPAGPPIAATVTMASPHAGTHTDGHVWLRPRATAEMRPQHTVPTAEEAAGRGMPRPTA